MRSWYKTSQLKKKKGQRKEKYTEKYREIYYKARNIRAWRSHFILFSIQLSRSKIVLIVP